ncbi:MAG: DNA recombination protein RmuC [Synergistaceae bacterium]|nr:DNA recombination protein RmuC [Synergistaceae bacterium]
MPLIIGIGAAVILAGIYIVISLSRFRESAGAMEQTARELLTRLQNMEARLDETDGRLNDNLAAMRREQRESAEAARGEQRRSVAELGEAQAKRIKEIGELQRESFRSFSGQLTTLGESQAERIKEISAHQTESLAAFSTQLTNISRLNEEKLEAIRAAVGEKLGELHKSNEEKLEKIRATVDEQLHSTLEKRLGEAFASVSERLEQVHKGLGEMRALTSDVGDLKKVLSNVKVRGTWGEMQLRVLLEQLLAKEQYAENVITRPNRGERVEFAIILPGADDSGRVLLPIDSKFPIEDYQRLISASEKGDAQQIAEQQKALRLRVLEEAKTIHEKYIEPPYTTDFGILYLPIEGLYAEVLRIEGLCDQLSRDFRVVPAGPTTICALLNSLQMGFRTLAIEKRSSEVWILLGKVKSEFEKFGETLDKTRQKIELAGKELEKAGVRTRAINRALKNVQQLPLSGEEEFIQIEAEGEESAPDSN